MALQLQQQVNMIMSLSTGMAWRLFYAITPGGLSDSFKTEEEAMIRVISRISYLAFAEAKYKDPF